MLHPNMHALAENLFNFDVAFLMLIVHNNVCAKSMYGCVDTLFEVVLLAYISYT